MTNLSREEQVWVQAFIVFIQSHSNQAWDNADWALDMFKKKFPKNTIQSNIDVGVYSDWSRQTAPIAEKKPVCDCPNIGGYHTTTCEINNPQKAYVKPKDRREFWIYEHSDFENPLVTGIKISEKIDVDGRYYATRDPDGTCWKKYSKKYHVTELHPGEVIVTRESLAKAWNERVWQPHQQGGIGSTLRSEAFKLFCKDLGLSE